MILVSRKDITALNEQYLKHSGATDVIAFDLRDQPSPNLDADSAAPGDAQVAAEIYVCVDVALEAATHFQTSPGYELVLYIVHGMLHIAGEDDHSTAARDRMQARQQLILATLCQELPLDQILADNPKSGNDT